MVYPSSIHRLVIIGTIYDDVFNTTLSMVHESGAAVDLPAVSDALLAGVATAVGDWWPDLASGTPAGIAITQACKLTSIKLNRIGEDGRYQDGAVKQHIYPTPIAGGGTVGNYPAQLSLVSTLLGGAPRARAGRGRMYWPPTDFVSGLGADGRVIATTAALVAGGVKTLLTSINAAYATAGVDAVAGIASKTGTGAVQVVASVGVGRVVDTVRSRRNKLDEDHQEVTM